MATQPVPYFPPFAFLKNHLQFKSIHGEVQVTLSYDTFVRLTQLMARSVNVNEQWYLAQNPDVMEGIRQGQFRSAKHHWIDFGYLEGRLPYELTVDSNWYLTNYPDIAEAVNAATEESALSHYRRTGFLEGRIPGGY
jgi:hypothetical protein